MQLLSEPRLGTGSAASPQHLAPSPVAELSAKPETCLPACTNYTCNKCGQDCHTRYMIRSCTAQAFLVLSLLVLQHSIPSSIPCNMACNIQCNIACNSTAAHLKLPHHSMKNIVSTRWDDGLVDGLYGLESKPRGQNLSSKEMTS